MSGFNGLILFVMFPSLVAQPHEPAIRPGGRANPPPKYVKFDFNGNPEHALAEFLKTKAGREFLQDFLQNELRKIGKMRPDEAEDLIRKQQTANPALRELFEKILIDSPQVPGQNPGDIGEKFQKFADVIKQNPKLLEPILKGIEANLGKEGGPKLSDLLPEKNGGELPKFGDADLPAWDEDEFSLEDRFGEWLREKLADERVHEWWNDFLQDAPEAQEAVGDLIKALQGKFDGGNWMPNLPEGGPGKWNFDLKPPQLPFGLGDLPKLPSLKMPSLPRLNLPIPRLGRFNLPGLPALPGFGGAPRLPGTPEVSGSEAWIKIALVAFALVVGFWLFKKIRWKAGNRAELEKLLAALPATVTTRTELRKAFDALALTQIGESARVWNHRLIARHLAETVLPGIDRNRAAGVLAHLYELARYTAGDERLTEDECRTVRESIAILTQGAA